MHGLPTPVVAVRLQVDGIPRTLWLKLEAYNLYGSIKGRTAVALWQDVAPRVDRHVGFIESSSGNLGLALAAIAAAHQVPFTAVVDPHISGFLLRRIRALGARVVSVDIPDSAGGYLLSRLAYVGDQLEREPGMVWTNQYRNPANPGAHARWTAPELHQQTAGAPMSVLVAVSTGGTLAGFRNYAAAAGAEWELVGVDVTGSAALGGVPGKRLLAGIGASRASTFLPDGHRPTVYVTAEEAVNACLWLDERTGLAVGPSSGALVAAALRLFHADPERTTMACLCPDGSDRYGDTVYSRGWRHGQGIFETGVGRGVEVLAPPPVRTISAAGATAAAPGFADRRGR
ncbi:pyridoxal-phosphate dependent enzyme [Streptomyces corynorhini]|uniref:Pyridoxal-phosphate dependent enzyme n=1 Tax=Streptomyces corynorhini TaxID=2282652 RepID=A0A370B1E0_9ACTN|nr:pyridoxal-phosphate dependent enzyme [Streptomyces corynorhini]RDG35638.1 pyridoxal-phosphate dependent enzyme [Streptomyces corynorhini]